MRPLLIFSEPKAMPNNALKRTHGEKIKGARLDCCVIKWVPRRQRVHLDDVPLHIVQCGHNREHVNDGHSKQVIHHWVPRVADWPREIIARVGCGERREPHRSRKDLGGRR